MKRLRILFTVCCLCVVSMLTAQNLFKPDRQTINLYGTLLNREGGSVYDSALTVVLSFNDQKLAETRPGPDGKYHLTATVYGNIRQVDVDVMHKGRSLHCTKNISVGNGQEPLDIVLPMHDKSFLFAMADCRAQAVYTYNRPHVVHWPTGAYYARPNYFDPVVYHDKITQSVTVTDKKGQPLAGVRVTLKVSDDPVPRRGITDENGKLTLYMQFDRGALNALVNLEADGYKPLRKKCQPLDVHTQSIYRMKKVH